MKILKIPIISSILILKIPITLLCWKYIELYCQGHDISFGVLSLQILCCASST